MFMIRKLLSIAALLVVTACSAQPGEAPAVSQQAENFGSAQAEKTEIIDSPAKHGTLADSVLAVIWRNAQEGHLLVPIDPASGQALADFEPISLGQSYYYAISPDGRRLAVVGYISSQHPNGGSLHLINLETWEDRVQELRLDAYTNAMEFSPNGRYLVIAFGNKVSQLLALNVNEPPIKSKSAAVQASMDFLVDELRFTSDGRELMVFGFKTENPNTVYQMNPEPPMVILLDGSDLSVRWSAVLEGVRLGILPKDESSDEPVDMTQPGNAVYFFPGLAFAPERNVLYVVHADEDKLTIVNFDAQEVGSMEIQPHLSWIEQLLSLTASVAHAKVAEGTAKHAVVSPDGKFLYIVGQNSDLVQDKDGNWQVIENPLGLQVVRAADGSRLTRIDTEANELSISPDGRYLYLRGWGETQDSAWTQVFDTYTEQSTVRLEGMWLAPTRRVNGAPILASSVWVEEEREYRNVTVDPQDLSLLAEWHDSNYLVWFNKP